MPSRAPLPDSISRGDAPMPSSFDDNLEFWEESRRQKLWRRIKEDPLIPVGLTLTCWALIGATRSIRRGNKTQTNMYFRFRVYAQAFTLLCVVVGGMYWKEDREKRKQFEGLIREKKATEKRDAWIKELEARDEEDRLEREARKKKLAMVRKERADAAATAAAAEKKDKPEAKKAAAADKNDKAGANSALSDDDLLDLVGRTQFLGKAMMLFRRRSREE